MKRLTIARMFLALAAGLTIGSSAAQQASGVSAVLPPPPVPIPAVSRWDLTIDGFTLAIFNDLVVISSVATIPAEPPPILETVTPNPHTCAISLRRQLTRNIELAAWHELVILGDVAAAKKSFSLTAYDPRGFAMVRYHVTDGYPTKLEVEGLKAGVAEVLYENVTFACEFVQRVSV